MANSLLRFSIDARRPARDNVVRRKVTYRYTLEAIYAYYKTQRRNPYNDALMAVHERILATAQRCFGKGKCITEIMPKDVRAYIAQELARGLKTSSVRRQLDSLCASVELYIRDKDLPVRNPFYRARVPRDGHDAKQFVALSARQLAALRTLCYQKDDSSRWLLALIADTGARTSEVSGAALHDLRIDAFPPHLVIEERPWRRLKTRNSRRLVPLAGVALWAARRVVQTALPGQIHAFPQYVKNNRLTSCSSNLNSWLRNREFPIGPHGLRHTFIDRLRDVDCPVDVRRRLLGWAIRSPEARYGVGPSLPTLAHWVKRIAQDDYTELGHLGHLEGLGVERLGACQNAEIVLAGIKELGTPTFLQLRSFLGLSHKDVKRGVDYCRRFAAAKLIEPQGIESRLNFRYAATGQTLPDVPLAQPGRRPKPLGIVKIISFRSSTRELSAPCFPTAIGEPRNSHLVTPRRSRMHCSPKVILAPAPALPVNTGTDRAARIYAETMYALMEPGHAYTDDDILAFSDLSVREYFRAKQHLRMLGIIKKCEPDVEGHPTAVQLTGKPLPIRKRVLPFMLSSTKYAAFPPDSVA